MGGVWQSPRALASVGAVQSAEQAADGAREVREQVAQRGNRLLELLDERARAGAKWECRSHGAVLPVVSPHDDLFERLVLLLPRPAEQAPEAFRAWVDGRLTRLDKYLQATNSGRVVQRLMLDNTAGATVMRRRGPDPSSPGVEWPAPERLPALMARFVRDVGLYARVMGDDGLRFLGALRLCAIPNREGQTDWRLTLDALDTLVGRREVSGPLTPLALVRGVLLELATIAEARLMDPLDPYGRLGKAEKRRAEGVVESFRTLAQWAQRPSCTPKKLARRLDELAPTPSGLPRAGVVLGVLVAVAVVGVAVWWRMR